MLSLIRGNQQFLLNSNEAVDTIAKDFIVQCHQEEKNMQSICNFNH